ncbi:MAG: GNAT family N-acetyltransferase [Flavonifractor plautii]
MEKADVLGWFDGDTLVSQVASTHASADLRAYLCHGRTDRCRNLSGYSNLGLMHRLLEQALRNMRRRGQYICYLYPYSIPITGGRAGSWYPIQSPEIKDYQLPKARQVPGQSGGQNRWP